MRVCMTVLTVLTVLALLADLGWAERRVAEAGGDYGVSVGQHQEGEGEQKAEQDKQEGAYAPDGCQDADDFVFACLWFHKD